MSMFSLTSFAWAIVVFTLSSALTVFYVVEVFRRAVFTSRDGQEPTTTQTSSKKDSSHRDPGGTGPLDYSGQVGIVFS